MAKAGSEVLSVDHPTDRLEALFLRVVGQAQREKLQTSGAESTVGVSQFLTGAAGGEVSMVETLVQGRQRGRRGEGLSSRPRRRSRSRSLHSCAAISLPH